MANLATDSDFVSVEHGLPDEWSWSDSLDGINVVFEDLLKRRYSYNYPLVWPLAESENILVLGVDIECLAYVCDMFLGRMDLVCMGPLPSSYGNTDYLSCVFIKR